MIYIGTVRKSIGKENGQWSDFTVGFSGSGKDAVVLFENDEQDMQA
jgi:hypothetical protein